MLQVLNMYGIKHETHTSRTSIAARTKAIEDFKKAGRDGPRVLIVSAVGIVGLNLACANYVIMMVSTRCPTTLPHAPSNSTCHRIPCGPRRRMTS